MAEYEILYRDPYGNLLDVWRDFSRLEYARKENEIGVMTLTMPRRVDKSILRPDARLEIWRTAGANTKLVGNTVWFLEDWEINSQYMELTAFDANWILDGAIVDYNSGSSDASCTTAAADDVMKMIIRNNISTATTTAGPGLYQYMSVDVDLTLAAESTKDFSRRNVLRVLQELAEESRERGTYLSFDVEYVDSSQLIFKTYTGQRGVDHGRASGNPVVVSENFKSLEDAAYREKHSRERTIVTAGGQGVEELRMTESVEDTDRSGRSPFGKRKLWVDARMCSTSDSLYTEALSALRAHQPVITVSGKIVDTEGVQFQVHYDFGDIVVAEFEDISIDAHVDMIHGTVKDGLETLDNRIVGYL